VLPYILYLVLVSAHMVLTREPSMIYGIAIDLAALVVVMVAIYKDEWTALWFGFAAGLVAGAVDPLTAGWQALILAAIGDSAFHFRQRLNLDSIAARLLLLFGGVLLHGWLSVLIEGGGDFLYKLVLWPFGSALYTTLVGWVFFLFADHIITYKKVRALF
jgi:rod shape-determining protein MreD